MPLNLFGTADDPKIFPDIGQKVEGNGGVLMAIREKSADNFVNLADENLHDIQHADDRVVIVPEGATVVDVQVTFAHKAYSKLHDNPGIMEQAVKYQQMHYEYYDKIVKIHDDLVKKGYTVSKELTDIVDRFLILRRSHQSGKIRLQDNRIPIEQCMIEITVAYKRKAGPGTKLSGRSGDKGVVSEVWPTDWMPIDDHGNRTHLIMGGESIPNRTNIGQSYEQFITAMSFQIHKRLLNGEYGNGVEAYAHIMQYIIDMHPSYGNWIAAKHLTETDKMRSLMRWWKKDSTGSSHHSVLKLMMKE